MTCRDCKYFDVRNHRAYCRKGGDYLIPDSVICPNFESRYQITTTRNPYVDHPFKVRWHGDDMDALLYGKWNTERKEYHKMFKIDMVKKVIFNPPATIVYWSDGTKTVVKAQGDDMFDKEKGFAMACAKKFFGNKGNYYNEFRKHGADQRIYNISIDLAHPTKFDTCHNVEFPDYDYNAATKEEIEKELGIISNRFLNTPDGLCISDIHEAAMPSRIHEKIKKEYAKSDYIVKKVKEFTSEFWMLKVYSELDTEEWVLDIGVMNNDMGNSMRYIVNLEDVEWGRIDESIGRVTSSIANELIPSVWEKGG